jgi:bifunctional non-homologous end joining protein LigD
MLTDLAGIVALAQMSVLEIHVWGARADDVSAADQMTFDLDPGPGVSWKRTIEGAIAVRNLLEAANLVSYVKTSGGKGLHVVVPLRPAATWEVVEAFAAAIVGHLVSAEPDAYVGTMSKAKRPGKIFIDHFRNRRSSTTVAPYSTRARPGAAVSAPLAWDELKRTKSGDEFDLREMAARVKRQKRDPWGDFFDRRQSLTPEHVARSRR